ncbi:MAG: energy transducer TonB, partial [Alphaproteobacteria bacterium]|nr:energy transducer TonB [Alphaproteobacteria bacterium]
MSWRAKHRRLRDKKRHAQHGYNVAPRVGGAMLELRMRHGMIACFGAVALHVAAFAAMPITKDPGAAALGVGGVAFAVTMTAGRAGADADASYLKTTPPVTAAASPLVEAVAARAEVNPVEIDPVAVQPAPVMVVEQVNAVVNVPADVPVEIVALKQRTPTPTVMAPRPEAVDVQIAPPVRPRPKPAMQKPNPPPRPARVAAQVENPPSVALPARRQEAAKQMTAAAVVETRATDHISTLNASSEFNEMEVTVVPPETRVSSAGAGQVSNASNLHGGDLASLTGGGAVENPSSDYMSQLRYWLNRHKDYPKSARRRRMQGVVYLSFRVTRDGSILTYR